MEKIFYADKSDFTTETALKQIFSVCYGRNSVKILRTEHGKPYVNGGPYFSVTHTKNRLYIVFSSQEIGLDAESLARKPRYDTIMKKFSPAEQAEIDCAETFLKHWVVKESAVKYLGGTLAMDLRKLEFTDGYLTYDNTPFPAKITLLTHEEFILSICGNGDFDRAEFVSLDTL